MQETIILLRQQLDSLAERQSTYTQQIVDETSGKNIHNRIGEETEIYSGAGTPTSVMSLNRVFAQDETKDIKTETTLNSQVSFSYKLCSFLRLPDTPSHCDKHFWGGFTSLGFGNRES